MKISHWRLNENRWCTYVEDEELWQELLTVRGVEKRATYAWDRADRAWDVSYPEVSRPAVLGAISAFKSETISGREQESAIWADLTPAVPE